VTDEPDSLIDDDALVDTAAPVSRDLIRVDMSLLTSPVVVRAMFGIAVGVAVLVWPDRTDRVLFRLIGLSFVVVGLTLAWAARRQSERPLVGVLVGVAQVVAGVVLITSVVRSPAAPGRLIGASLIVVAVVRLFSWRRRPGSLPSVVTTSVAMAAGGVLTLAFPVSILSAFTGFVALTWVVLSVLVLVVSLDPSTSGATTYRGAVGLIGAWLLERPKSADARQDLYDKILFDGPNARRRLIRFVALMSFASVIASMGVLTDSTAVVIGAMLIAPLMTPLMGMAISLVMGWPNQLARSTMVALAGVLIAIGISMFLGFLAPTLIDPAVNAQILGRTNPTTMDLVIAVAAGVAGAYGLSRPDVSDSLPGVAVAIALVPPLAVVGISYSQGEWHSGNGALLLFLTNMVAILIMGGLTFIVTGVTPVGRAADNQYRVRTALGAVATVGVVVLGGLLVNGTEITTNAVLQSRADATVEDWLDRAPMHALVETRIDGDMITAVIVGPSEGVPDVRRLAKDLRAELRRSVTVDLRIVVEERQTADAP
jgi:uncharacterized hydrophobic protein (TIGR00271 family)